MVKIKVKSVGVKKQTDTYTIKEIETEDGIKYDTFNDIKECTEVEGEITPNKNPKYNANFKLAGSKKAFAPKDYTADKRMSALSNAVNLCCAGKITLEQLTATRDKFFTWLNTK